MPDLAGGLGAGSYAARATPSYAPTILGKPFDPVLNVLNWRADNTRLIRAGLGRAAAGGNASFVVLGDSLSSGVINGQATIGSYGYDRKAAWPISCRDELATLGIPTSGTGFIRAVENTEIDARVVSVGGGWIGSKAYASSAGAGNTIKFWNRNAVASDAVDFWYLDNGVQFTASVSGAVSGAGFASVAATNTSSWRKLTLIPTGITTPNGYLLVTITSGTLIVLGASFWTPGGGLVVHNVAQGGSTASGVGTTAWSDFSAASLGGPYLAALRANGFRADTVSITTGTNVLTLPGGVDPGDVGREIVIDSAQHWIPLNTYITGIQDATHVTLSNNSTTTIAGQVVQVGRRADAVFIVLGANDHPENPTPVDTVVSAIRTIVQTWAPIQPVLALSAQPAEGLVTAGGWQRYGAALWALALELDCPLIDFRARFGTWGEMVANGITADNGGHLIPGAYRDLGRNIAHILAA